MGTDLPPNEWPGNNLLGWALMAVRCRLRAAASQCEDYNLPPSPADCATRFTGHQNADRPDADSRPPLSSHGATQCSDVTRHDSHTHPPTTDGPHRRHAPDIEPSCHTAEGDTALAHLLCTETLESNLDKVSPTTYEPGAETAHQWDHASRHVHHKKPNSPTDANNSTNPWRSSDLQPGRADAALNWRLREGTPPGSDCSRPDAKTVVFKWNSSIFYLRARSNTSVSGGER